MSSKELLMDEVGENHICTNFDTPLRRDAFLETDEEKIKRISHHFKEIMYTLVFDLADDSLRATPRRVAKMYVQEEYLVTL